MPERMADAPAGAEHGVGDRAHQADVAAAIDEFNTTRGEFGSKQLGRVQVVLSRPLAGTAEDAKTTEVGWR